MTNQFLSANFEQKPYCLEKLKLNFFLFDIYFLWYSGTKDTFILKILNMEDRRMFIQIPTNIQYFSCAF